MRGQRAELGRDAAAAATCCGCASPHAPRPHGSGCHSSEYGYAPPAPPQPAAPPTLPTPPAGDAASGDAGRTLGGFEFFGLKAAIDGDAVLNCRHIAMAMDSSLRASADGVLAGISIKQLLEARRTPNAWRGAHVWRASPAAVRTRPSLRGVRRGACGFAGR